ncbi:hypothetical protein Cs7R123_07800 [Catellatospora sp. TT07R-123]|uniref:CHAT domain-containing protein n=1 Tax=Catellatospora sp. TT07R-123 TaxID=2733863 RepID=UPI001B1E4046|nr:CHAT domain-containing tetratricopeptide repeat protein [Catellatospora sp. TT07R-123]GHJ43438.1 hypothetical protein Cs7R123_07800 [Catellatospora sp. TT07R-123]
MTRGIPDSAQLLSMVFDRPRQAVAGAQALLAARPTPYDASIARQAIGIVWRDFGDITAAVDQLTRARRLAARSGSPDREADVLATLGIALIQAGRSAAGVRALNRAVALATGPTAARVLFRRAGALRILGRHREALADVRQALPALRRAGDQLWTARALTLRGLLHASAGDPRRADTEFAAAEQLFATLDHAHDSAMARQNRATTALLQGDLPAALSHLAAADRRFRLLGTPMPSMVLDRCATLLAAGLPADALREADRGLRELDRRRGQQTRRPELLLIAAQAALAADDQVLAAERAAAAVQLFGRQHRRWWQQHARLLLLQAETGAAVLPAGRLYVRAAALARQLDADRSVQAAQAHLLAGQLALRAGRPRDAERQLAAAALARRAGSPLARAVGWLARALQAQAAGDVRGVRYACRRGLDTLDAHRLTLGATELRVQVTARGRDLAALAQRSCLGPDGDPAGAGGRARGRARDLLVWSERWRSVTLATAPARPPRDRQLRADLAALRAVARRIGDDPADAPARRRQHRLEQRISERVRRTPGAAAATAPPGGLRVAQLLDTLAGVPGRQLVDIVEVDGRLHVLLCGDGRVRRFQAGRLREVVTEGQFARTALRRLAFGSAAGTDPRSAAVLAQTAERLQRLLLAPVLRHLHGEVVIVPPADLHAIPWSLLPVLHERPFTVAPSAGAWLRAEQLSPPAQPKVTLVRGPRLPYAAAELAWLRTRYPGATVLGDGTATIANVLAALEGSSLAHIAAHGVFRGDNPLFSALVLDDGPLTVHDVQQLRRAPYRLVLPSCDSAALTAVGADELLGLATALLPLGTAALVASPVAVNDQATAELMAALHEQLAAGASTAGALAHARLACSGDPVGYATGCSFVALGAG